MSENIHEEIDRLYEEAARGRKLDADIRQILKIMDSRPGEHGLHEGDPVGIRLIDGLTALYDYFDIPEGEAAQEKPQTFFSILIECRDDEKLGDCLREFVRQAKQGVEDYEELLLKTVGIDHITIEDFRRNYRIVHDRINKTTKLVKHREPWK